MTKEEFAVEMSRLKEVVSQAMADMKELCTAYCNESRKFQDGDKVLLTRKRFTLDGGGETYTEPAFLMKIETLDNGIKYGRFWKCNKNGTKSSRELSVHGDLVNIEPFSDDSNPQQ